MNDYTLLQYSRQIMIDQVGISGQEKLLESRIIIVGAGGLGCSTGLYLAGSGIGSIKIFDFDKIELSNLPRQILFNEDDINDFKAETMCSKLQQQFPKLNSEYSNSKITKSDIINYKPDIILDCGDNLELSYLLSEIAEELNINISHASVSRVEGHLYTYIAKENFPTIKKVFPNKSENETCSQLGVLTPAVAIIAGYQSLLTVKTLLNPLLGEIIPELILFDGINVRTFPVKIQKITNDIT